MKKYDYYVELHIDGYEDADECYQAQSVWCKTKQNAIELAKYLKGEVNRYDGPNQLIAIMPWEYIDEQAIIEEENKASKCHFYVVEAVWYDDDNYDLITSEEIELVG